jgi:hypothetical protein
MTAASCCPDIADLGDMIGKVQDDRGAEAAQEQDPQTRPATPGPAGKPDPPAQSTEDTDIGWGELPDADGDDRLRDGRPPHWDSH